MQSLHAYHPPKKITLREKIFSKFKIEKPEHVLYKRGRTNFEAALKSEISQISVIEVRKLHFVACLLKAGFH